jgi:hypothetical protein
MRKTPTKWDTKSFIKAARKIHGRKYDYSKVEYVKMSKHVIIIFNGKKYKQSPEGHLMGYKPEGIRKTTAQFVKDARKIHGSKYDYSKVKYVDARTPIIIIFKNKKYKQTPIGHLNGNRPEGQSHPTKKTTKQFIKEAKKIHGRRYDYSETKYVNYKTPVIIILNGKKYKQTPNDHLAGCKPENKKIKLTTKQFIKKARKIHGNKYDYSLTVYQDIKTPVIIMFNGKKYKQAPDGHLFGYKPEDVPKKMTTKQFIRAAKKVHGNKYDYSLTIYSGRRGKIKIIYYGDIYEQDAISHLNGYQVEPVVPNKKYFLEKAIEIHGNTYDYSKVNFIDGYTPVIIILNGKEYMQTPYSHLLGKYPETDSSNNSAGELKIRKFLTENNILFNIHKKFIDCRNILPLAFDIYLPDLNICIEYDGELHSKPNKFFGGQNRFDQYKINDFIKDNYCRTNNIHLIRIPYTRFNYIEDILSAELLHILIEKAPN